MQPFTLILKFNPPKATDSTMLSQLTFPQFVLFVLFSSINFDIAMSSRDDVLLAAELGLQEWLRR